MVSDGYAPLCRIDELSADRAAVFRVGSRNVAAVLIEGTVYAFDAVCPHWNGPLGAGAISASRLEVICPWHRFRYSLETGACTASTGRRPLAVFPVRVEEGEVFVLAPPQARTADARASA